MSKNLNRQIEEYLGIEEEYKTECREEYEMVMNEARIIQKAYSKELESDKFCYAFHSDISRFLNKYEIYEVITTLTHLTVFQIKPSNDMLRYEKILIVGHIIKDLEISNMITFTHKPYIELVDLALRLEQEWLNSDYKDTKVFSDFVCDRLIELQRELK